MIVQEAVVTTDEVKQLVAEQLLQQPVLLTDPRFEVQLASPWQTPAMSALYRAAYQRGDYFAGRYEEPPKQIFNPDWLEQDLDNPDHLWFTFTNEDGALLGTTGFFHDYDSESGPLMNSDETQITPAGRGHRIMDEFFKRVAPMIEQAGAGLAADFVLSPETKGLRRTLQTGLGMIALGIHPHILQHPNLPVTRTEISGAKYPHVRPKPATILPAFEPLYRLVQWQLPDLLEPTVLAAKVAPADSNYAENYHELSRAVHATDPDEQAQALQDGFQPVAYNPDTNTFRMAIVPKDMPELGFIHNNERVAANKRLVTYMQQVLYKNNTKAVGGKHD
jgi:hypothetical protein